MNPDTPAVADQDHRLRINSLELVGGFRTVMLHPGVNLVRGDITTGKTTFVRLIRGLLGAIPKNLPPETAAVRYLRAELTLGATSWRALRPMVTTREAPVELAQVTARSGEDSSEMRLRAAGSGGYGEFLLNQLGIPLTYVPRARSEPTSDLSPVTINDWLNYCIIPGDELDSQVFGHRETFREYKRRWVFEIAYGLYDQELAELNAHARSLDREISATETQRDVVSKFLTEAQIGDRDALEQDLTDQRARLRSLVGEGVEFAAIALENPVGEQTALRGEVLALAERRDELASELHHLRAQAADLADLERELAALSRRLTRSIVADEWLVDFDFLVCPRCGSGVDRIRARHPICYLCLQPEHPSKRSGESLLVEQDRVAAQISETRQLVSLRRATEAQIMGEREVVEEALQRASTRLDASTRSFISSHAAALQTGAALRADAEANVAWIERMLRLFDRQDDQEQSLAALRRQQELLQRDIEEHEGGSGTAEANIRALEERMLDYLERLRIPSVGDLLSVRINRSTYLPEVSTRNFDELSSQGLKTLVNVAHALAHHTVAIDRGIPLPGLLVLDGVSANSGREGLDGDRILDMYRLFSEISASYGDRLQLIIVDNEIPDIIASHFRDRIVLTLSQQDRLIQSPRAAK